MSRVVVTNDHAAAEDRGAATSDLSWMLWTAVGLGGIWVAVLVLSLTWFPARSRTTSRWPRSRRGFGAGSAPWSSCG